MPAVSLRQDRVVIVRDNRYEPVEDERGEPFKLHEFIDIFLKSYPAVLVVDIDGIEQGAAQFDAIGELAAGGPEIWWDAAAHDHTDVINVLTAGADRAVVSTRQLRDMRELERAVEVTENFMFEVVTAGRELQAQRKIAAIGTPAQVAAQAASAGVDWLLVLDTARPLGAPVEWDFIAHVSPAAKHVYVGGGIAAGRLGEVTPPPAVHVDGFVVDLISILTPFL